METVTGSESVIVLCNIERKTCAASILVKILFKKLFLNEIVTIVFF